MSSADPFGSYDFQWLGEYGLESAIRVRTESYATGYQAHQFVLQDASGKKHYVYCADLMTSPQEGFRYNMETSSMPATTILPPLPRFRPLPSTATGEAPPAWEALPL